MEVIRGTAHAAFPLDDPSRVGEARRHAVQLAYEVGLDDVDTGRLALVVTELGTNLLRHAREGRLLIAQRSGGREDVEVIAIDCGPGIPDIQRSLRDGYSTGATPGTGLGAVSRLADDFDIHSEVPSGTAVLARVRAAGAPAPSLAHRVGVGAVSLCAPGESVCGDAWCFALDGERAAVLVADGLGHGADAAEAAREAVEVFSAQPFAALRSLVEQAHARLRATRGAAVAIMHLGTADGQVRYAGAGNVLGRLISGVSDRSLLTQNGTAGVTIRTVQEASAAWPAHALLLVHTDGVESRWRPEVVVPLMQRDPALIAAVLLREHGRGRDDATIAILRRLD